MNGEASARFQFIQNHGIRTQGDFMSSRRNLWTAHFFQTAVATILVLFIAGCGSESKPDPTPTATTAPEPTVGELADRIAAAWTGVSTMRTVSHNVDTPGTPSAASPAGQDQVEVVTEVILPDRKHQVSTTDGEVLSEFFVIGNDVYVRGPVVETAASRTIQWRVGDPSSLDPGSQEAMQIDALKAPVQPLYAGLSQDERGRVAKPLNDITVNGQTCRAYQIVDTTQTGERVDVTLAMNADDLPCSIQTKVSGVDYLTTFEFNIPLTIAPPIINVQPFQ
jgi:hypothetical protein